MMLGEGFKCFPACRKTLEIDDFSSIIDPSGLKGAGKWQSQKT
jgi:hypothetical protein